MNRQLRWDDLRLVLAVAEAGTLAGAGRRLGVSHATVFRRIDEVERRMATRLFERSRSGYAPTPAGEEVADAALRIDAEVAGIERRVAGRDLRPAGTLRVTTTDTLLLGLLSPLLAGFRDEYPDIALEVAVSNEVFNLTRREADVALRPSSSPPETLAGRRLGVIAQAVYARVDDDDADEDARWVGPDERMGYHALERWMAERGVSGRCRYRVDTVLGLLAAVRDGAGRAVLPCYLAEPCAELHRVGRVIPALATDLWLLWHPDLRRTARLRAFSDFVATQVRRRRLVPGR